MNILRDITVNSRKYWYSDEMLIFIGARQAGKTTILKQIQTELEKEGKQCFFLTLEDPEYLSLLDEHPRNLFKIFSFNLNSKENKKAVVFIDEIQYLKNPSNFLKYLYDEYKDNIKLIVSGSSAFYIDRKFTDSLSGRKHLFFVPTLSFREYVRFCGNDKLAEKNFSELSIDEKKDIDSFYREFIIYGGYPRVALAPIDQKEEILREIAYSFIKKDIYEAGIRQEESFYGLLRIFAEQIGGLVNTTELANTLNISKTAIDNYLFVMNKSFIIHLVKPFARNVRKEISKMPKAYFLDLGLRNFFIKNFSTFEVRHDKGQVLENAVFRELLNKHTRDDIRFWRTITKKEIDFIVAEKYAFEVKTNPYTVKEPHFKSLLELYPDILTTIVTFNTKVEVDTKQKYPIKNVWEL